MKTLSPTIRIVHVVTRMNVGGPAVEIAGLLSAIGKRDGFEQTLITGVCEMNEIDFVETLNITAKVIKVEVLKKSINFRHDFMAFLQIRRIFKSELPNIVHTHTSKAGILARIAAISLFREIKLVHTFHGHVLEGYFSDFKNRVFIFLERILGKKTHAFVTVGNNIKLEIINLGICDSSKIRTIVPGFDIMRRQIAGIQLQKQKLPTNSFSVVWIGRFEQVKRPDRLLEIARICKRRNDSVHFIAVGDGSLRHISETTSISEDLPITFLGWQLNVVEILASVQLLLVTSENEGTPLVIIEAQKCGVPILSTRVGSIEEIIKNGETGFCLDYNAVEFQQKIKYFQINQDVLRNMSANAFQFGNSRFTLSRYSRQHRTLYQSLANF
jgi:glycosyltransferase involved in cell wall biosynthesis